MIALQIIAPFATFRKSFARSFAETYPLAPPSTVYGMLLSLVGERYRHRHEGVGLAFAYEKVPRIATVLRKLSRYKYGVAGKQSALGNAPDYVESLCDLNLICWVDSSTEFHQGEVLLEQRIETALFEPELIKRYGVLSLGLSDDAVDTVRQIQQPEGDWFKLVPSGEGHIELPIWVDHVGAAGTRWQRFDLDTLKGNIEVEPPAGWPMTMITSLRK